MQPVALFLCEKSLRTAQPWADAGYLCYCVDKEHPAGETRMGNFVLVGADIHDWQPPARRFAFACAMPTCTDLTKSGARWWKGKGLRKLAAAILLVARCTEILEALECPYYLENPNGALSTHWRKYDFAFDPCEYAGYLPLAEQEADAYTKRTNLWTGGGFRMPKPLPVWPILGSKMHLIGPGEDRAELRSESPKGFSLAVFLANDLVASLPTPLT